jgi:NADP-dependent 3-hydroxy acid dehydrogenase YdfG
MVCGITSKTRSSVAVRIAMFPDAVAAAISYAISQPDWADVNEIVARPAGQRTDGWRRRRLERCP